MDNFRIQLLPEILWFHVSRIVNDEVLNLLQCSTKSGMNSNQRNTGIQQLATAVTCGRKFATKVFKAIEAGDENKIIEHNLRCDSMLAAGWPQKIGSSFSNWKIVALLQGKV